MARHGTNRSLWLLTFVLLLGLALWWQAVPVRSGQQDPGGGMIDARRSQPSSRPGRLAGDGGVVTLPPGEHVLTQPLELTRGDTRIQGSGSATHLINRNESGLPALILRPSSRPASNQDPNGARIWRIQVADLRISGNPKSGDAILGVGINELYLHGLYIDHNGGHAISLSDCFENPRITDCNITYNGGAGLHLKSKSWNPVIGNNHFEENRDGVVAIRIYNISMTGNSFDDQLRHGIVVEDSWGGAFTGNVIEQCSGIGMILDRDCYGMNIGSNTFGLNTQGGLDLRDAWGCTVSANTFCINARLGLAIGPGSGRITVVGNTFSDSFVGPGIKHPNMPASGIHLEGTSDISIVGNLFSGLAEQAIQLTGKCRRVVLSSNILTALPKNSRGLDLREPHKIRGAQHKRESKMSALSNESWLGCRSFSKTWVLRSAESRDSPYKDRRMTPPGSGASRK